MTNTTNTEASVLAHHGIAPLVGISDDKRVDLARDAGLIYACLGCGSIGGINPAAPLGQYATVEDARRATRDALGEGAWECCGDTIIY